MTQTKEELTKEDLYEIEKVMDNYAGQLTAVREKLIRTAIEWNLNNKTSNKKPIRTFI
jgi:hypothetical protein